MSKLIVLSGIPGAGKSTWATDYASKHNNTIVLSTDALRFELFGNYLINQDNEKIMRSTLLDRARAAAKQNIDVVLDSAVVKNKGRMRWINQLADAGFTYKELIIFEAPFDICLERNRLRDRHVPEDVMKQMYDWKEEPSDEVVQAFDNIIKIQTS